VGGGKSQRKPSRKEEVDLGGVTASTTSDYKIPSKTEGEKPKGASETDRKGGQTKQHFSNGAIKDAAGVSETISQK